MGDKLGDKGPKMFYVNWFRKNDEGKWLWPGFGDNSRVLKWMCERVDGTVDAIDTPIGLMPKVEDLDLTSLDIPTEDMAELLKVDAAEFKGELDEIEEYLNSAGDKLPARMKAQFEAYKKALG